ncbi:ABC transporter substrate-binding protein [Candidatus Sumerlaeota bacterium]|nr:ABC transporter substrate-binding protein [Candidatus Sumerlaeota bacterium]
MPKSRPARIARIAAPGLLALTMFISGCGGDGTKTGGATDSGVRVLRISQGSDVLTMDPYAKNESPTYGVLVNIFEPLTDVSADMKIVPGLAESWRNIGPTVWEFKLRRGVKFHNGRTFDAEDVQYSLERARDWPLSRVKAEAATVKSLTLLDPYTVLIETTVPDAILPTRLTTILMLDKQTSEEGLAEDGDAWLATHPIGTGPYKLEKPEDWVRDAQCILTANEEYWKGAPQVKKLNYLATSNDATRIVDFLDGRIDVLAYVPVRDIERVKATPGFRVITNPSLRLIYLGLDSTRDDSPGIPGAPPNPLKDLRIRQAMYAAINEDLIVEKIMNGQAVAAGQLFPDSIVGYDDSIVREPYDLDKAKALMEEAGYADGFDITLETPNNRYVNDDEIAQAIAGQLARIDIRVRVNARPKDVFFKDEEQGFFSFFLIGWTNPNGDGYGTFDHLLHTPDAEKNLGSANLSTNYSNLKVDELTEAAMSEFDPAAREKLLQEAVRIVMHDLPHIPLHYQMDIYAVSDDVKWTPRRDTQIRGVDVRW